MAVRPDREARLEQTYESSKCCEDGRDGEERKGWSKVERRKDRRNKQPDYNSSDEPSRVKQKV